MTTRTKTIAEMLIDKRGEKGLKSPIIERLGVTRKTYNSWERGSIPRHSYEIKRIAEYLGIDEEDLAIQAYRENRAMGLSRKWPVGIPSNPPPQSQAA